MWPEPFGGEPLPAGLSTTLSWGALRGDRGDFYRFTAVSSAHLRRLHILYSRHFLLPFAFYLLISAMALLALAFCWGMLTRPWQHSSTPFFPRRRGGGRRVCAALAATFCAKRSAIFPCSGLSSIRCQNFCRCTEVAGIYGCRCGKAYRVVV